MQKPVLIAEIGCNHQGNMDLAKQHIKAAAGCGANYAKFQKRDNNFLRKIYSDWDDPHPNGNNAYGKTYYEHRQALEFTFEQHIELQSYCVRMGIGYSCSVWDPPSAELLSELKPDYIKIPSAMNTNKELLDICFDKYNSVHISLGMTTTDELDWIYTYLFTQETEYITYHCTSGYPVPFDEIYLPEVTSAEGYSGHHHGIAIDVAAYTLGARYIERHFTLDRTMKGTDHAASLEPGGLAKLSRDLHATYLALQPKTTDLSRIELPQRKKLKWPNSTD